MVAIAIIMRHLLFIGDAVGMAIGDYLSSKAEEDHENAERKREQW
jgi:hypothetical protein